MPEDGIKGRKRMAGKEKREKKKKRDSIIITIEVIVVFAVVAAIMGVVIYKNASAYINTEKAVVIDGDSYSVSDVNYFYYAFYNQFCKENSSYLEYMFDEEKSLKDQKYDEGVSWFSYFLDETITSMTGTVEAAKEAKNNGYELSSDSRKEIQDYMDGITQSAENAGMSADDYIEKIYGRGMTMERYEQLMEISYLATEFADKVSADFTCTDEDIDQYFQDHPDGFVFASYERAYVKACDKEEEPTQEQRDSAKKTAEDILAAYQSGTDLETVADKFGAVYYATEDAYYSNAYSYGDWLFKEDRAAGDTAVIDDTQGYYVMVFRERGPHSYQTVDIRDIALKIDKSGLDSSAADYRDRVSQLYEESCLKAEELKKDWETAGKTEEYFAKLADENTSTENLNGGLYEKLKKNVLNTAVDKWCFDTSRKPGDCQIIYTEEGFHLVYFVGKNEEAWRTEVLQQMQADSDDAWYNSLMEKAKVKRYDKALDLVADSLA